VAIRCGLRDSELANLAHIGAFAAFDLTRREALWQAAAIPKEPLFSKARDRRSGAGASSSPLPTMSALDRTLADYKGTGITVGPHLMQHLRQELTREGVLRAADLRHARNGQWAKIAGLVIVRQRPGTAKGFCFLTLEDETGTSNAVVVPDMFQRWRALIHTAALLLIEGPLQKVDGVIHVRARVLRALSLPQQTIGLTGSGYRMRVTPEDEPPPTPPSHDFR
jgi:error-prone DNA polymerase